jgi:hypothetical protein
MKFSKLEWSNLVNDYNNGKSISDICLENPDVKKSSLRYHIKKSDPQLQEVQEFQVQVPVQEPAQEPAPAPAPKTTVSIRKKEQYSPVTDSFLDSIIRESPVKSQSQSNPFIQSTTTNNLLESLFEPESLLAPLPAQAQANKGPSGKIGGHTKAWWFGASKEKKVKEEPDKFAEDNEQMVLVQKIRLYFVHFPELDKLHIVTRKKGTDIPDVEKWLISLYTKKVPDLEKTLNFIRFHVRNNISENSSIKLASNILETSCRVLEHTLMMTGIKANGLTQNVIADPDITRCIKEILIDNSVTSLHLGPKSDLALKIGMKIVAQDSQNRIEQQMNEIYRQQAQAKAKASKVEEPSESPDKYPDL